MTVESSTISIPSSTFFAASAPESFFAMPRNPRQRPPSVCTDSGWGIRKTAWRPSLAVNGPQLSWNCTPLRSVIVQSLPLGDISHFSANSGMYAPVWRSIPTRYSRAGRLSSMPLRLCSQVKFVSQPRGATATRSRSSLVLVDGVGVCAHAIATISSRTQTMPHSRPRYIHLCIVPSSATAWAEGRQLHGAPSPSHASWCQLDVLQVGEVTGDDPWERILRDILGVHGRLRIQPEQRDLGKLIEFMVPDLPTQAPPLPFA